MCNTAEITPAGFLAYLDEERPGEAEYVVDPDCLCDDDVRLLEAKAPSSGRKSGGGGEGPPDRAHACCAPSGRRGEWMLAGPAAPPQQRFSARPRPSNPA